MAGRLPALLWLRSRVWWHRLRSPSSAADTAVGAILALLGAGLSVTLAVALSWITFVGIAEGSRDSVRIALSIVFWMLGFMAIGMPVVFATGPPDVPLRRLLVFPFSHRSLYLMHLGAATLGGVSLFWYPALAGVAVAGLCAGGAHAGTWLLPIAVFGGCLVVWCNTVLLLIQWILRRRSSREVAAVLGLALLVIVAMVPAVSQERAEAAGAEWFGELVPREVADAVVRAASFFPPSILADTLTGAVLGRTSRWIPGIAWLVAWTAAGLAVGYRIVRRDLVDGSDIAHRPQRPRARGPRLGALVDRWSILRPQLWAAAGKELRYLLRSTSGKFNLVVVPVFVVVAVLAVGGRLDRPVLGLEPAGLMFIGLMLYAAFASFNFLLNTFAWEGRGVQAYFFSPIEMRSVVLGKNIGVWIYTALLGAVAAAVFLVMAPLPSTAAVLGGVAALAFATVSATIVGNFISPTVPVGRDIGSITNSPSQTAGVTIFGLMFADLVVVAGCYAIGAAIGSPPLGTAVLAAAAIITAIGYRASLRPVGRLLHDRREALIETLMS